jgi:hypothetical protein
MDSIWHGLKILIIASFFSAAFYMFGYFNGQVDLRKEKDAKLCIDNLYTPKDKPDCVVSADNILTGMPDGETGWFKKFSQPGICGLYTCKGEAQGSYECFEQDKLDKK